MSLTVPTSPAALACAAFIAAAYVLLCQLLRFRRAQSIEARYGNADALGRMSDRDAGEILRILFELEFPTIFYKGLEFAFFRTYGIPTISRVLTRTGQLSTKENVGKRYADTAVILAEIYTNAPSSPKGIEALARLNFLHSHYIRKGQISNDDLLYVLAAAMIQPVEWINRFEWRRLTPTELAATGTFHKSLGDAMHIRYDVLPGSKTGWRDGIQFYHEVHAWCQQYERDHMVPDPDNYRVAVKTLDLLLTTVPRFTHGLVTQLIAGAMDDCLRGAIMFEPGARSLIHAVLKTRQSWMRYFALPRPGFLRSKLISDEETRDGRRWIEKYSGSPHYVKPTLWNRWGPLGLYQLIIGAPRSGDSGMLPEGYVRLNVGPRTYHGKGTEFQEAEMQQLRKLRTGGCPFG